MAVKRIIVVLNSGPLQPAAAPGPQRPGQWRPGLLGPWARAAEAGPRGAASAGSRGPGSRRAGSRGRAAGAGLAGAGPRGPGREGRRGSVRESAYYGTARSHTTKPESSPAPYWHLHRSRLMRHPTALDDASTSPSNAKL